MRRFEKLFVFDALFHHTYLSTAFQKVLGAIFDRFCFRIFFRFLKK